MGELTIKARDHIAKRASALHSIVGTETDQATEKEGAEHKSGEVLLEKLTFVKHEVTKHLGQGFVDETLLKDAETLSHEVYLDQYKNIKIMMRLASPVWLSIV